VWAEFNNGVAAALQVATSTEVSRGWIAHHRSVSSNPASADGQVSSNAHAGFLLGLGLRGCLKVLPVADCYKYLRLQHETTSAAVILGLAASNLSSMDAALTRTCCVHIPSMLPATFSDVEVSSPVQCSAVLSLGLLYAGSGHRMMTELMVAEIGRKPSDRVLHDRESYSLAAGVVVEPVGRAEPRPTLRPKQRVILHGLEAKEFNGKKGKLMFLDESLKPPRWHLTLESDPSVVRVALQSHCWEAKWNNVQHGVNLLLTGVVYQASNLWFSRVVCCASSNRSKNKTRMCLAEGDGQ
ncbi:unnamed protein product, partial [Cladocopium goreaui]